MTTTHCTFRAQSESILNMMDRYTYYRDHVTLIPCKSSYNNLANLIPEQSHSPQPDPDLYEIIQKTTNDTESINTSDSPSCVFRNKIASQPDLYGDEYNVKNSAIIGESSEKINQSVSLDVKNTTNLGKSLAKINKAVSLPDIGQYYSQMNIYITNCAWSASPFLVIGSKA
jgi:hypothetical protein